MSVGKILAFIVMLLLGLVGLAMSVCGGGFLFSALLSGGGDAVAVAGIAVPTLVVGAVLAWVSWRVLRNLRRAPTGAADARREPRDGA